MMVNVTSSHLGMPYSAPRAPLDIPLRYRALNTFGHLRRRLQDNPGEITRSDGVMGFPRGAV